MFIPAPAQDLQLPLTQRLEASPVVPVTAVPGVAEDAQSLDSRVALQWTQPVFAGAEGQAGRSALAAPLPEALLQQPKTAVPGYEPQGADPDALRSGDVHPLLAQGLSQWISGALAKTKANGNLTNITTLAANVAETPTENLPVNATDKPTQAKTSEVLAQLQNIYQNISGSDVFAAQRLNEAWMPRKVVAKVMVPQHAITNAALERFQQMAQPVQEPSTAQLTQWVAALEPDSDTAEQAARMLSQGNMVWQAELVPGLPMRIVREDAWRNNPQQADQIEKGASLKVDITLPNFGQLRIVGSQWGQDISLQISHGSQDENGKVNWTVLAPGLLQDLRTQGITDVRIESLPNASIQPEAQESPNV